MIYSVLSAIANQLQVGLADVVSQPDAQIKVQLTRLGLSFDTLPRLYLIPSAFELASQNLDPGGLQTDAVLPTTVKVQKPLQQGFGLEIYGQDAIATEQLASLAMGILLTSSHDLVRSFNQGSQTKTPTRQSSPYRSTSFTTQFRLHHIQLQGGEPCTLEKTSGICIRGIILGQLEATRQISEGETPIQTVSIEYKLSERN